MTKTITELPLRSALSGLELIEFSQLSTTVKKTGVTVSAAAADNSFNDSANGFLTSGFAVGDRVGVAGFTNAANNLLLGVITILTAGKMTIGGTDGDAIVNESAGNAVTIAKWTSKRATAADLAGLVTAGIPDAPSDGTRYVRKDAAWSTIPLPIGDAPSDGTPYSRKDAGWVAASVSGVPEAPISMTYYARQNGAWAAFTPGGVPTESIIIAVGDEVTAITTGVAKVTFRMPYAFTLTAVRASLVTASSSGLPTVDINEAGVSILSTKLTIDASEKTSTTAATPAVISDASLADDAEITIDIDVAGTGAAGLKVYLIGHQ